MDDSLAVFGWVALGFAVSFVAMILPFRRGPQGVVLNMVVAVAAAVAGGLLGRALGAYDRLGAPLGMAFAAATSMLAALLLHVLLVKRRDVEHTAH